MAEVLVARRESLKFTEGLLFPGIMKNLEQSCKGPKIGVLLGRKVA